MTQRTTARLKAPSPGSSARVLTALLLTFSLIGAGTTADAAKPKPLAPAAPSTALPARTQLLSGTTYEVHAVRALSTTPITEPASHAAIKRRVITHTASSPKKASRSTTRVSATNKHTTPKVPRKHRLTPTRHKAKKVVHHTVRHVAKRHHTTKTRHAVTKRVVHAPKKRVVHRAKKRTVHKVVHTKARTTKVKKRARASASGGSIISIARRHIGAPYRYAATGPSSFDCSGFTSYVYRQAGKPIPRMARDQYTAVRHVSNPRPGDLIFFINGGHATHAGIYAGPGKMYDAPRTGRTVGLHDTRYYNGAVRYGRV